MASVEVSIPAATESSDLPLVLGPYLARDLDRLCWWSLTPLIRHYPIEDLCGPDGWTSLFQFLPGCEIPQHGHANTEMTLVLRGAYRDCYGRFGPGDLADLDDSHAHNPVIAGDEPCIALIATSGSASFERSARSMFAGLAGI